MWKVLNIISHNGNTEYNTTKLYCVPTRVAKIIIKKTPKNNAKCCKDME